MIYKVKKFKRKSFGKKSLFQKRLASFGKKFNTDKFYKFLKYTLLFFVGIVLLGILYAFSWFNQNILQKLPDISKIEDILFAQTTIIQDRNGVVLYKLFDENRKYINYDQISPNMVNALIAIEDKNFWTHPGFDPVGIIRAGIYDITHQTLKHGGSTITQQLMKNLLLTSDRKIERKLKEIVLAVQLDGYIKKQINSKYKGLTDKELDKKSKEKTLELYLNYIPFGNNTYGIETASQLYFGTSAINLDILQSAILASIPKSATIYNPYTKRENVIGTFSISNDEGEPISLSGTVYENSLIKAKEKIESQTITFMNESEILELIKKTLSFELTVEGKTYKTLYVPGRKDEVLARMFDSKMIDQNQIKDAILRGIDIKLEKNLSKIKAPHFVFYIIELLEKQYGTEMLRTGGLTVKTSIDYNIQTMAEESTLKFREEIKSKGASNASMIYLDSKNGDILAYLGSIDYYDDTIDGKVDMIQSLRQPGSTIKPIVYALGMMKNKFTIDTPIFDLPLTIGGNNPQNVDGKYNGLTTLKEALGGSRNLPAIKMFFIDGGESALLDFMEEIGIISTKKRQPKGGYGYSLSIGAGELKMIELANAYMHLSALGKPAKINPILEIRNSDGSILYKKNIEYQKQIIPSGVAYLVWDMLSNKNNFPADWRNTFTFPGFKVANKSGTTNTNDGKVKLPRDGWMANYTPSKVAIFWAGNTKGQPMNSGAFGGWLSSPIWKDFFTKLEKEKLIFEEEMMNNDTKSVPIVTVSGKLPTNLTPSSTIKTSLGYLSNSPNEEDDVITKLQIDKLCNGLVNEDLTPKSEIIDGYLIKPYTIMKDGRDLESVKERWKSYGVKKYEELLGKPIFLTQPENYCVEREIIAQQGGISLDLLSPTTNETVGRNFKINIHTKSPFDIIQIKVFIDGLRRGAYDFKTKEIKDSIDFEVNSRISDGVHKLKVIAIDDKGYESAKEILINISSAVSNDEINNGNEEIGENESLVENESIEEN